ncbi:ureidoglycolate hydrolase [Parachaetomium inaequale]|uniref:Ureidoglycolate hydrolase n=1 Tax=Parachaetomium inaequale TaxID=2588326 RepID=A0AAN6PP24_9PEZI|nr:ureidoglycolate hydrolase [Parachaetomium inaequale]
MPPPPRTINPTEPGTVIEAVPLTREAFAPFGDVVENPRPDLHPSSAEKASSLPSNAVVANQGSAIKYQHVSRQINLYEQAPSGRPGSAVISMFVCAARARIPDPPPAPASALAPARDPEPQPPSTFPITVLERHPFTTQTFIPLTADPTAHYLVIVAPSLPPNADKTLAETLPVPASLPPSADYPRPLPGGGMPDLRRLRAFVASAAQAVTYGAGTWHAPMVALGERGTAMDFVVVQFGNGVAVEDCQEVFLEEMKSGASAKAGDRRGILVALRPVEQSKGESGMIAKL